MLNPKLVNSDSMNTYYIKIKYVCVLKYMNFRYVYLDENPYQNIIQGLFINRESDILSSEWQRRFLQISLCLLTSGASSSCRVTFGADRKNSVQGRVFRRAPASHITHHDFVNYLFGKQCALNTSTEEPVQYSISKKAVWDTSRYAVSPSTRGC